MRDPLYKTRPVAPYAARFGGERINDFIWASGVQAVVALAFRLGGIVFLVEEILLFSVLVLVKHRATPPWGKEHSH